MSVLTLLFVILTLCALVSPTRGKLIDLPPGVRSESLSHIAGNDFILSDVYNGDVYMVNVATNLITHIVRAKASHFGFGVKEHAGTIYVTDGPIKANGERPSIRLYNVQTGENTHSCQVNAAVMLNDVAANDEYAYMTDSVLPLVHVLHLASLPACVVSTIALPVELFGIETKNVLSNGIALLRNGLLIGNSHQATIYCIDLVTNEVYPILAEGYLPNVDGIALDGDRLYAAQSRHGTVSQLHLHVRSDGRVGASRAKEYCLPEFLSPTGVAAYGGNLVVANFNLDIPLVVPPTNDTFSLSVLQV